jgi:cytochrome c
MTGAESWRTRAIIAALLTALVVLVTSCSAERKTEAPARFAGIGRAATPGELRAWDIDVNPTGSNLPPGSGSYATGAAVFAQKCAACHGAHGEGISLGR